MMALLRYILEIPGQDDDILQASWAYLPRCWALRRHKKKKTSYVARRALGQADEEAGTLAGLWCVEMWT